MNAQRKCQRCSKLVSPEPGTCHTCTVMNDGKTHWPGCWADGPAHYFCAVGRVAEASDCPVHWHGSLQSVCTCRRNPESATGSVDVSPGETCPEDGND
jgi:hypothetical protein